MHEASSYFMYRWSTKKLIIKAVAKLKRIEPEFQPVRILCVAETFHVSLCH